MTSLKTVNEATIKDLKKEAIQGPFKTKARASLLKSTYIGLSKQGDLMFKTTSGTTPGKFWFQKIRLVDFKDALDLVKQEPSMTDAQLVNLAIFGNIKVYCNDPSFTNFGWKYIAKKQNYGIAAEGRFPSKRNRYLEGSVCKHLLSVINLMPFITNKVTGDLVRGGFIPVSYQKRRKG